MHIKYPYEHVEFNITMNELIRLTVSCLNVTDVNIFNQIDLLKI